MQGILERYRFFDEIILVRECSHSDSSQERLTITNRTTHVPYQVKLRLFFFYLLLPHLPFPLSSKPHFSLSLDPTASTAPHRTGRQHNDPTLIPPSLTSKVKVPLESMAVSYVHMIQPGRGFHKGNLSCVNFSYKERRSNLLVFASMQTSDHKVDSLLDSVKWDDKGLAVAIAQNVDTGAILMQGFANREAVATTLSSRKATFYSRSRSTLWTKGETSNNFINVHDVFLDCDRDSIIYLGKPDGPTCHTGAETCYYTSVFDLLKQQEDEGDNLALTSLYALESTISQRKTELTGENEKPSWTKRLLLNDKLLCSKIREEANELCQTLENNEDKSRTASEMADVLYHSMVLLAQKDVKIEDVLQVLRLRFSQSGIEEKRSRFSQKPLDH